MSEPCSFQDNWQKLTFKNRALYELKYCACAGCLISSSKTPFGSPRGTVDQCRLTPCYVFSAGMQGWTVVLLPLSHFSQRSNTTPPQRGLCSAEAFHVWDWDDWCFLPEQRAVQEQGQGERGSCLIAPCYLPNNEASEVIKMVSVLSKS